MKPLFLPDVERNLKPSPCPSFVNAMRASVSEYSQIWHLFAFHPATADHLAGFTEEIMRETAPISPGIRELIAAYTSRRNDCLF